MPNFVLLPLSIFSISLLLIDRHKDTRKPPHEIRLVVQQYCEADFNRNVTERSSLVKFSKSRLKDLDPMLNPGVYFVNSDPIFLITGYSIGEPESIKNNWKVPIVFDECAVRVKPSYFGGLLEEITPIKKTEVKLNIININGKYLIHNPPEPRVGIKQTILFYEKDLKIFEDHVVKSTKSSKAQLDGYKRIRKEYELMKSILAKFTPSSIKGVQ